VGKGSHQVSAEMRLVIWWQSGKDARTISRDYLGRKRTRRTLKFRYKDEKKVNFFEKNRIVLIFLFFFTLLPEGA